MRGASINLMVDNISRILHISMGGWGHYVKFEWPPLDNLAFTLEISRKLFSDPYLFHHCRVLKREMSPVHQLYFDVVPKMILLRKERSTEENFLDLSPMEILDTNVPSICFTI